MAEGVFRGAPHGDFPWDSIQHPDLNPIFGQLATCMKLRFYKWGSAKWWKQGVSVSFDISSYEGQ